jgi:hypothetical protein
MIEVNLRPRSGGLACDKIQRRHRDRLAVVYIRQSTPQQVDRHQESTRLQYALVDRALQFGWSRDMIVVIDDDQGRSGSTIERPPRLPAPRGRGRPRARRSGARHRDVPSGTLVPGLAPAPGDLRLVRHAD